MSASFRKVYRHSSYPVSINQRYHNVVISKIPISASTRQFPNAQQNARSIYTVLASLRMPPDLPVKCPWARRVLLVPCILISTNACKNASNGRKLSRSFSEEKMQDLMSSSLVLLLPDADATAPTPYERLTAAASKSSLV